MRETSLRPRISEAPRRRSSRRCARRSCSRPVPSRSTEVEVAVQGSAQPPAVQGAGEKRGLLEEPVEVLGIADQDVGQQGAVPQEGEQAVAEGPGVGEAAVEGGGGSAGVGEALEVAQRLVGTAADRGGDQHLRGRRRGWFRLFFPASPRFPGRTCRFRGLAEPVEDEAGLLRIGEAEPRQRARGRGSLSSHGLAGECQQRPPVSFPHEESLRWRCFRFRRCGCGLPRSARRRGSCRRRRRRCAPLR